ncbi:cupin domain-containing carboxymuconolactone decarboxylase family protein [Neolewinella agarilytica]|uniref:Cupin domain protein n=1 Tax=Neolewinella agarilytica TaxID=478744 RepID=A0A1H9LPT0_9BACT|nr:carboxymuconolactone decarboxylase family protein [Neolewinella agarilytica]SER13512.1 Cupin domain protein [Neolewinella agarilytica]
MRFLKTLLLLLLMAPASAQKIPDSLNVIFGPGQRIESPNFTGPVWVERMVIIEDETQPVPIGNVTFPPKSRSNWHHHSAGQTLLVLDGVGYYQEKGGSVQVLRKGDKVQCPSGVEHWHGAANDHWFVQLALTKEHPDGRVIWGEPVTNRQYQAGLTAEGKSWRYYHLARVAALATQGDLHQLEIAFADALEAGLTVAELREAMVHLYAYAGFPRSIQGLKTLMATTNKRAAGDDDMSTQATTPPEPPTKLLKGKDAKYDQGLTTLEQLTGRAWTQPSDYGQFAPRIDVFLKEHLFADVFADQTLSYADREVITVAVLATLGEGVEPMLAGHSNIARHQGVSEVDLRMIRSVLLQTQRL